MAIDKGGLSRLTESIIPLIVDENKEVMLQRETRFAEVFKMQLIVRLTSATDLEKL